MVCKPIIASITEVKIMFDNDREEYTPRIFHTRFGIIVTDKKHCRFVIIRVNTVESPLVFLREWSDDTEYGLKMPFPMNGMLYGMRLNSLSLVKKILQGTMKMTLRNRVIE